MDDGVIQMQLCHLRFNGRYPLFDCTEVVFDLPDIAPDRAQGLKDQVFNTFFVYRLKQPLNYLLRYRIARARPSMVIGYMRASMISRMTEIDWR
jgi:hypothetical protein